MSLTDIFKHIKGSMQYLF